MRDTLKDESKIIILKLISITSAGASDCKQALDENDLDLSISWR